MVEKRTSGAARATRTPTWARKAGPEAPRSEREPTAVEKSGPGTSPAVRSRRWWRKAGAARSWRMPTVVEKGRREPGLDSAKADHGRETHVRCGLGHSNIDHGRETPVNSKSSRAARNKTRLGPRSEAWILRVDLQKPDSSRRRRQRSSILSMNPCESSEPEVCGAFGRSANRDGSAPLPTCCQE